MLNRKGTFMESGFGGLKFSQIINSLLYIVSGFFFGIFASRNSLFSVMRIRKAFAEKDFSPGTVFSLAFSFLFLITILRISRGHFYFIPYFLPKLWENRHLKPFMKASTS